MAKLAFCFWCSDKLATHTATLPNGSQRTVCQSCAADHFAIGDSVVCLHCSPLTVQNAALAGVAAGWSPVVNDHSHDSYSEGE